MSNYGLRGHETVIRMVGKRRKLTLSAISPKKPDLCEVKKEAMSYASISGLEININTSTSRSGAYCDDAIGFSTAAVGENGQLPIHHNNTNLQQHGVSADKTSGYVNWVQCPICSKSVRGDVINIHLDICLQGGMQAKKRNCKQLTIAQFGGINRIGKLSSPPMLAEFHKRTSIQNPGSFGSSQPAISSTQENDTGQPWIDEKSESFPSPGILNLNYNAACQSEVRQRLFTSKDDKNESPGRKELLAKDGSGNKKTEPANEKYFCSSPTNFTRGKEESIRLGILSQPPIDSKDLKRDKEECEKDPTLSENFVAMPQSGDRDCPCDCHILKRSSKNMGYESESDAQFERTTEEDCDLSMHLVGASEKIRTPNLRTPLDVLEIGTMDGRDSQSTNDFTNDAFAEVLNTKIVGRRFNRNTICKEGMQVTLVRDAGNPKDSNAIKVVESPTGPVLGHLAREISLHLSSLLDQDLLQVLGSVTAIPEQSFGPVPIKLFLKSKLSKENFLKLNGAQENLFNVLLAAENLNTVQKSTSNSGCKYQQNFLFMLQTILDRDSHLFKDDERTFLETFSRLPDDSQRLFIRLSQRKGPWFRLSNVEYKDVADVSAAAEQLLASGYMTSTDRADEDSKDEALRKRFQTLNVLELRQFVCTTLLKRKREAVTAKKDELINMALSAGLQKHVDLLPESLDSSGSNLVQMLAGIAGEIIRVSDKADFLLWRLQVRKSAIVVELGPETSQCLHSSLCPSLPSIVMQRLFFLNGDIDLSAFLLVDLGLVKYPRYKCWRARKVFETREDLLAYEQALEVAQGMDMALECNDTDTALKLLERARSQMSCEDSNHAPADRIPTFLARFSASYVYKNVCTLGVSILERERRYCEAVDILKLLLSCKTIKSGRWGYWTVRLSMDLDHLGRKEESLQVAEEGVSDPWIRGGDRVSLQRRVVRLGKPPRRWKKPPYAAALNRNCAEVQIQGRPLDCVVGLKSRFYGYDGKQCGVEELALQFYASDEGGGWQGVHCEGGVWMTFFGLLFWDVLFADVPDVFQTSFQTAPLDLDTEVFFFSRQGLIEAQLEAIAKGGAASLLTSTWNQHQGTMCRGVNWERHSLEELQIIASCIGGPGLSAVCRLLAEDHAGWSSGMPDLLLWRVHESHGSEHHSSQVKRRPSSCANCICDSIKQAPLVSKIYGMSTTNQCSVESGKGLEHSEMPRENFCKPTSLTRTTSSTKNVSKAGEAKLVEVKGPRDRLSEQQRAWIWILMNAGLDIEVCKVLERFME